MDTLESKMDALFSFLLPLDDSDAPASPPWSPPSQRRQSKHDHDDVTACHADAFLDRDLFDFEAVLSMLNLSPIEHVDKARDDVVVVHTEEDAFLYAEDDAGRVLRYERADRAFERTELEASRRSPLVDCLADKGGCAEKAPPGTPSTLMCSLDGSGDGDEENAEAPPLPPAIVRARSDLLFGLESLQRERPRR